MEIKTIANELSSLPYHGRGIMIGKSADGKTAVTAYFIMGRSVNSRNRIFVAEGDGMRTKAFDESKMTDPHLIIYYPVRVLGNKTIVTNGDQTDTIYELMGKGQTFEQALTTREFEDDAPNFTPRISGIINLENGDMDYAMSILKSADGDGSSCQRYTYTYANPIAGRAKFIHTYKCDGNPLPSFEGEPKTLELPNVDIDTLADLIWTNLNEDNKVSLFVRYIDLESGKADTRIINKNA
ncbi:MAG: inosine monophosphate cyclohydrolase [Ruminococcaceae bacterium]|nr:inosine monophosphate cyclohydrolase [Oscillospiraceae bacterium]